MRKKQMKHYVVLWTSDYDGERNSDILGIAHSFEKARKIFNETYEYEKEFAKENNWTIYEDSDTCFDAGEDGFYADNHTTLMIEEVE